MRAVIKQHPELDIRLLFQKDNIIAELKEKLRYTEWARKYGFPSAIGPQVPDEWLSKDTKVLKKAYKELGKS